MKKTFVFKLYRSGRNKHLHKAIDIAAQIYNHCIALHKRYYRLFGKYLNKFQLQKHITKLKKLKKYHFWKKLGSQAIQDIADRIDKGYDLFFSSLKLAKIVAPPSFRKRRKYKSITLKQAGYKLLENNKIQIGKKYYKFHKSREIEGRIKTLTIKRDVIGDTYLCFSCETSGNQTDRASSGKSVGFDFGLKCFLTSSTGEEIVSPFFFKKGLKEIRQANRNLSKKKKGSNNRRRAKLHTARIHKKIANKRRDYHFKLARGLALKYDNLFFEDLNMKALQRKWGRKVADLGFGAFLKILGYYCEELGSNLHQIDRFYPSSKQCNCCDYIKDDLSLKDREWTCPSCQEHHHRDINAAINIHRVGASTLGVGEVRLALVQASTVDPRIPIHS